MGGKFSRNKGRREEQQLVLALAKWGYKAERILRQYQAAGQADVKTLEPAQYTFEMKARQGSFKTIYDLYYSQRDEKGILSLVYGSKGTAVAMSSDFPSLLSIPDHSFRDLSNPPADKKILKVFARILKLQELKQAADFLVIKDNNKVRLYIKYWPGL